ncbi:cell morphogenesis N-terminal-domain-containing protein [Kalaharituber pfeilii]|nr:cell morphogenesis N-terminal-domain-containing protein [Kalaharituber pfeilii]
MSGLPPSRSHSPRPSEARLERIPSATAYQHAHHRQTSIVNGVQHSRSGSLATGPIGPSALSPQLGATREQITIPVIPQSPTASVINLGSSTHTGTSTQAPTIPEKSVYHHQQGSRGTSRGHHHSHSHHHSTEPRTTSEYALHILFTQFVRLAERKINACLPPNHPLETEPLVDNIIGAGVDPAFDKLIGSLGSIAKSKPKPVIDSVMFWRKSKSDAANSAREGRSQYPPMPRRNTEPAPSTAENANVKWTPRELAIINDRRSTVSIYILCRVLIEIIGQSSIEAVTKDMAWKLEDIIFNQLRSADPETLARSPLRVANWRLFGMLLGVMSNLDFETVTDRFFKELEDLKDVQSTKDGEAKVEMVVRGMTYLRLKLYPEAALEESAEFMNSLANFFNDSKGPRIKHAYLQIFSKLLLPVAAAATTELNHPTWQAFIGKLMPKLSEMIVKPKHWHDAFPVLATLLCAAPPHVFMPSWMPLIEMYQAKLRDKDRYSRILVVQAMARLVWVYLFRCQETLNVTTKKLETTIRMLLFTGKKKEASLLTAEQTIVEPCIQLIRFIGFKYQDLCFRTVIFPLLNSEYILTAPDPPLEQLAPERMVVGIQAFLAIMADLEKGDAGQPPFPKSFQSTAEKEPPPTSTWEATYMAEKGGKDQTRFDRLSRAVATEKLGATAKEYHDRFCEILGKIVTVCDAHFGGQVVLDEKFASVPRTPVATSFSFGIKDDHPMAPEQKQSFYELLHVAIQALPRCLPSNITFPKVVGLLCNGTAHVDKEIAMASANALKSIARQYNSQGVIMGFSRFIFQFDERYSTTPEGGMLGVGHIENTLKLYVELLEIWVENIKRKAKDRDAALASSVGSDDTVFSKDLENSNVRAYVEEIESNGLFFLCSQSRVVRRYAIIVLRIIKEFDSALEDRENSRIIEILENDSLNVIKLNDDTLPVAERSRLQRELRSNKAKDALVQMATSDNQYDSSLWFRVFPKLIRVCFERCPITVALCRENICQRLHQMHNTILGLANTSQIAANGPFENYSKRYPSTSPEVLIEQWKLYVIVACSTLTLTDDQGIQKPMVSQHARKTSKNQQVTHQIERVGSARVLFQMVIPLLPAQNSMIREAVVIGLGSININLYKTLIETLQPVVMGWANESKVRTARGNASTPRRGRRQDRLRTEVTHVFQLTSHFLLHKEVYSDDWILQHLAHFIKEMKAFLSDPEVQTDWEYQKLRRYFCGLMEELYEGIMRTPNPRRWLPFEGRLSCFVLMQDWCGYGPNWEIVKQREEKMRRTLMTEHNNLNDQGRLTAAMEIEKRNLRTAALSAMASLCAGPLVENIESRAMIHFNVDEVFQWVGLIFQSASDRLHRIGRRALKNVLMHNQGSTLLLSQVIQRCYIIDSSLKATQSYFAVVSDVLIEVPDYLHGLYQTISLCLFKIGDENADVRTKAANLLRVTEERNYDICRVQDYEVSISDKTAAVYKRAQFELSKSLSKIHPEEALFVFSEFTMFFKEVEPKAQRDILAVLLPWIQTIELQLDPNGDPTPSSYMVVANLFEITIKFSSKIHNEVEALWVALATAPYAGNVKVILEFIINQSLERREPSFVEFGKQVVVFLASTPAGAKLVEALIAYLQPRLMTINQRDPSPVPEASQFPYLASLNAALPSVNKQNGFSYGHLALILLVDLLVGPVPEMLDSLPLLLQVVFVLWDHYVPLVQEQAKEMLIHLIHELVIPNISQGEGASAKAATREFIETVRQRESKTTWAYEDITSPAESGLRVPEAMENMICDVLEIFSGVNPGLKDAWGKISLSWATSCPVRHLACRSFQVFRCLLTTLDQSMLSDMLARLSNTIADNTPDIQLFAMEILITLNAIVAELDSADLRKFPQLFWATVACLNTIHEREFMEVLSLLEKLLDKMNLGDPELVNNLLLMFPPKWEGNFEGLQALIVKGLRSSYTLDRTLIVFDKLNRLPSNELVGGDSRLLFAVLANLPRFLEALEGEGPSPEILTCAASLRDVAENQSHPQLARVMNLYASNRLKMKQFLSQTATAIKDTYFPEWEVQTLIFLVGFLSNKLPWVKTKTMKLLNELLPHIDMRKPEFAGVGADVISPLLRLLQTDYCQQALEVLDKIISISGGPMDRHVVRMSMGNRTIRKEYERTQTIFGIPDESGWAIPMPAINALTTRNNVHAVFYTCTLMAPEEEPLPTADVQFHMEDYSYGSTLPDRSATMLSDEGRAEVLDEMVLRLDNLDAFFADERSSTPPGGNYQHTYSMSDVDYGNEGTESAPQIYDSRVYAILNRSLTRTPSVASLHTSFENSLSQPQILRDTPPGMVTPTAFTAPPIPNPRFATRSASSPIIHTMPRTGEESLSEEEDEKAAEEEDYSSGEDITRTLSRGDGTRPGSAGEGNSDGSFLLENLLSKVGGPQKPGGVLRWKGGRERTERGTGERGVLSKPRRKEGSGV